MNNNELFLRPFKNENLCNYNERCMSECYIYLKENYNNYSLLDKLNIICFKIFQKIEEYDYNKIKKEYLKFMKKYI